MKLGHKTANRYGVGGEHTTNFTHMYVWHPPDLHMLFDRVFEAVQLASKL